MGDSETGPRETPKWLKVFVVIMMPLAIFYLFVVPMLAAVAPAEHGTVGVLFGAFMLLQLFMLVGIHAFEAARSFYGLRPPRLVRIFARRAPTEPQTAAGATVSMFLSYAFLNYAFAVLYVFVSNVDAAAFSAGRLSAFDGWYFSVLTGATVAFGDVVPRSDLARAIVMAHITLSIFYVVLLFSASSSHLAKGRRAATDDGALVD